MAKPQRLSHQELLEVMKVGYGHRDMLRAGEDYPARPERAHDEPIEDEQVNQVEDEKHSVGIGEAFAEGVSLQRRGAPKQSRSEGSPDEQAEQDRHPALLLRSRRDDLSDFLRVMPYK